jgi:D-alanine transaminase
VVSNLFDRPEVARILLITSRQTLAGQVKVTLTDERTVRDEADVVVLATPDPQHEAARVYLEAGCAVVTTSDDAADVGSLLALERLAARRGRPFVVGAAASPGLTGLLARLAADELDTDGASNVFVVRGGVILSPPKSNLILPGITYDVVVELAQGAGLPLEFRDVSEAEVRGADEIWVTSSSKEVLAVVQLDGKPVGTGKPGPVFSNMYRLYQEFKQKVMRAGKERQAA